MPTPARSAARPFFTERNIKPRVDKVKDIRFRAERRRAHEKERTRYRDNNARTTRAPEARALGIGATADAADPLRPLEALIDILIRGSRGAVRYPADPRDRQ